jgi:hypothetical protein
VLGGDLALCVPRKGTTDTSAAGRWRYRDSDFCPAYPVQDPDKPKPKPAHRADVPEEEKLVQGIN